MASLRNLRGLQKILLSLRRIYLGWRHGIVIAPDTQVSLSARFFPAGRGSIRIGTHSLVAFHTVVMAREGAVTHIGANCFIGGGAMILPGVRIGDNAIVGAGAVVFDDVPPRAMVLGNAARVVRSDLQTGAFGRLPEADANTQRYYHAADTADG